MGAEPGVIPELNKKLESDDLLTRAMAVYALQNIGPQAMDAVPSLILLLDDDRISGYDHVINEDAALALYLITGEQLGLDKEAWQDWFQMQGN
jgi:HEAT repeat protein